MTLEEFSNSFDTQLNSYAHTAQFGDASSTADIVCDEYEKSVFLTKAQEEITLGLYNGRNPLGEAFEGSEELRRYLSKLVVEAEKTPITNSSSKPIGVAGSNSYFFNLPDNPAVWFITYEAIEISSEDACKDGSTIEVVPIKQDEYHRLKKNPFRGANDRRALRLDLSNDIVEIVSEYIVSKYYIRYLRRLNPIILSDLDGNDIGGKTTATECELPDILHQKILERAVMMALQSKGIGMQSQSK
jgi:hypothetical protein